MDKELGPRTILVERGTRTLNMDLEPGLQDTDVDLGNLNKFFVSFRSEQCVCFYFMDKICICWNHRIEQI